MLGQFSSHFQNVPECIFFYTQQRLNIRGTDHKKLRYPVSRDRYRDTYSFVGLHNLVCII